MAPLDLAKSRQLKQLLESLTHSGSKDLNNEELKMLLEISNENLYLIEVRDAVMTLLKKDHSEVRYSTVQVIHELFMKFEEFRKFLLNNLHEFLKWTLGIQSQKPLPPPLSAAKALKKITLSSLATWEKTFLTPKLSRVINYLEKVEHVDFNTLEVVDPKQRKEKEEWDIRMMKLNKERLKKITEEVEDMLPELRNTTNSLETCFELLFPLHDEVQNHFFSEGNDCDVSDMRVFGIVNSKHSVEIELENKIKVVVDEENSSIVDAAKDAYTLINNRFLPKVKAWVEIINKAEGGEALMRKAMKMKNDLESKVYKYQQLDIVKPKENKIEDEEEDLVSSDSDLEEVPELKPSAKQKTEDEIHFLSPTLEKSASKEHKKTKEKQTTKNKEPTPGTSSDTGMSERKKQLMAVAPKVTFDVDLYHWEDEKLPTPTMVAVSSEGSRFWGGHGSEELVEIPVPDGAASLRTRVIEFTGRWEPVNHTCRAPLPSGKLCPRKDRIKCPFHGIIVERDEKGNIIKKEDKEKVAKSKSKPDVPDWQDPKLLAEIKAQTGMDLKMPEKGKRIKKKKYPGLTDIKELKNTTEHRLSKKIFNKKSLKRVAETLDKIDHKKHRDKFGDQFNYVHGT